VINLDQNTTAVFTCKKCGHTKPITQFYSKGNRRPTWCKACDLGAKTQRRIQKKKLLLEITRRRRTLNAKTLDISTFEVIEAFEPNDDYDLLEIAEQYVDKTASGSTRLKETV
jgi:hypothetical protein